MGGIFFIRWYFFRWVVTGGGLDLVNLAALSEESVQKALSGVDGVFAESKNTAILEICLFYPILREFVLICASIKTEIT